MLANLAKMLNVTEVAILAKFGSGCWRNVESKRIDSA